MQKCTFLHLLTNSKSPCSITIAACSDMHSFTLLLSLSVGIVRCTLGAMFVVNYLKIPIVFHRFDSWKTFFLK